MATDRTAPVPPDASGLAQGILSLPAANRGSFVDIEPDVDFSFVYMVCLTLASRPPFGLSLRDRLSVRLFRFGDSGRVFAQFGAVLADRPSRAVRVL